MDLETELKQARGDFEALTTQVQRYQVQLAELGQEELAILKTRMRQLEESSSLRGGGGTMHTDRALLEGAIGPGHVVLRADAPAFAPTTVGTPSAVSFSVGTRTTTSISSRPVTSGLPVDSGSVGGVLPVTSDGLHTSKTDPSTFTTISEGFPGGNTVVGRRGLLPVTD